MTISNALKSWAETLSWSFCSKCSSLMFGKLLPSFSAGKKCSSSNVCQCTLGKYIVPTLSEIPQQLKSLQLKHILVLRPIDIDYGKYDRMKHGFCKKTALLKLTCSKDSLQQKISAMENTDDRQTCQTAYDYLIASHKSSYKTYVDKCQEYIDKNNQPDPFSVYSWDGIECALWPHLYPYTSWCDTLHDGKESRNSNKISFLVKCCSSIVDYSNTFDFLQFIFERWIYKTVMGAINSSHFFSKTVKTMSAFQALDDKPFASGYWQWQHPYLMDAVRQFGYPSIFLTISPSEWSFPLPMCLQDIARDTGYGPTSLPFYESIHYLHVLEQIVRGYLWLQ